MPFKLEQTYEEAYAESISNPEKFWAEKAKLVSWSKPWTQVLDDTNLPFAKWFVNGEINACYNAVDRHVEAGNGHQPALIYENPTLNLTQTLTYADLQQKIAKLAGAMAHLGVKKGDRVIIYFPVIPEACIAMLACARLGAIHSVVFGGFSSRELSFRIEHSRPRLILAASCAIEHNKPIDYVAQLTQAITLSSHKPHRCIIFQRPQISAIVRLDGTIQNEGLLVDWEQCLANATPHECVPVEASHPLYVLYTSGTTGEPKGVVRPTGGHLVSLAYSMRALYGMRAGDRWWTTSDFGWVVGHSYMCYAPLLAGLTNVIYEGKPAAPDPLQYFRMLAKYRINGMFTVPTILRILRKHLNSAKGADAIARFDLNALRAIFVAGEHCDQTTKQWTEKAFKVGVWNHWWQTETGHCIAGTCLGLECKETSKLATGRPFPGFNLEVKSDNGTRCEVGELGRIVVKLPLPPGTFLGLYESQEKCFSHYFKKYPGYYDTVDAGFVDENGCFFVTARDDDIINVAGHRISTLSLENIILAHSDVTDACVISVPDPIKNEVPFCFFTLKNGDRVDEELIIKELVQMVRVAIGPVASFKLAASIRGLPQTRSGKICRKLMSQFARHKDTTIHSMVTDPSVFDDVIAIFQKYGFYEN